MANSLKRKTPKLKKFKNWLKNKFKSRRKTIESTSERESTIKRFQKPVNFSKKLKQSKPKSKRKTQEIQFWEEWKIITDSSFEERPDKEKEVRLCRVYRLLFKNTENSIFPTQINTIRVRWQTIVQDNNFDESPSFGKLLEKQFLEKPLVKKITPSPTTQQSQGINR
jgi:hypothetical protein